MSRIIRIDDEVRSLLEERRRYKGECLNQVLRRLANLDPDQAPLPSVPSRPLLSRAQAAALGALRNDRGQSAAQIASAAGIGLSTAGKALNVLEQRGLATRLYVPGDATRRWRDEWRRTDPDPTPAPCDAVDGEADEDGVHTADGA